MHPDARPPIGPALAALAAAPGRYAPDVAVWLAIRDAAWPRDAATDLGVPSIARTCDLMALEVRQALARLFARRALESLGGRVVRVLPWPPVETTEADAPGPTGVPDHVDLDADHYDDGFSPAEYARLIPALARPRAPRADLDGADPWPFDSPADPDEHEEDAPDARPAWPWPRPAAILAALDALHPVYSDVAAEGAFRALAAAGLLDAMNADPDAREALGLPPAGPGGR